MPSLVGSEMCIRDSDTYLAGMGVPLPSLIINVITGCTFRGQKCEHELGIRVRSLFAVFCIVNTGISYNTVSYHAMAIPHRTMPHRATHGTAPSYRARPQATPHHIAMPPVHSPPSSAYLTGWNGTLWRSLDGIGRRLQTAKGLRCVDSPATRPLPLSL